MPSLSSPFTICAAVACLLAALTSCTAPSGSLPGMGFNETDLIQKAGAIYHADIVYQPDGESYGVIREVWRHDPAWGPAPRPGERLDAHGSLGPRGANPAVHGDAVIAARFSPPLTLTNGRSTAFLTVSVHDDFVRGFSTSVKALRKRVLAAKSPAHAGSLPSGDNLVRRASPPRSYGQNGTSVQIERVEFVGPASTGAATYAVTVRYQLNRLTQAEINFGAGRDGGGYAIARRIVVDKPSGRETATLTVAPATNRDGQITKTIHVNLSAHPHGRSWSPLAGDSWDVAD